MDVSSMSVYRWVVTGIAIIAFKFAVDNALSVRMAFAGIKYVSSASTVSYTPVPGAKR